MDKVPSSPQVRLESWAPKGVPEPGGAEEGRAPACPTEECAGGCFNVSFYEPTPIPNNSVLYSRNKNAHL